MQVIASLISYAPMGLFAYNISFEEAMELDDEWTEFLLEHKEHVTEEQG